MKAGVRQVYISSLDELRRRLDLHERRVAGVSEDDLQQIARVAPSPIDEDEQLFAGREDAGAAVDDDDLEVDQEKLDLHYFAG
ncbi:MULTISPECIES: hypothetical protein [Sinorhizobium]|uniref:Uncharacterized protein n=1 Tax=Sinorhizobium americanum TaxID=194963 RepID=A0A2S3YTB6_9HYPH|nr:MULTISPECIES: hypothetical protein [Sinorhizobium]PDT37095.1 hypothetical protein CO656_24950 [Sinorhizobium sp. FG01]POH34878.1 hypothetical protein ATY31_05775 [Sinorhizobium americanum]